MSKYSKLMDNIILYYCIVLLYCIIVLYYCVVLLYCITVLNYCIVLFAACEQVIHTGCNVIQGVCQCGDSCTHSFEFADRETCLNSVKSQGNWYKNPIVLFYIHAFPYQGSDHASLNGRFRNRMESLRAVSSWGGGVESPRKSGQKWRFRPVICQTLLYIIYECWSSAQ